jgi:hypothetical protein
MAEADDQQTIQVGAYAHTIQARAVTFLCAHPPEQVCELGLAPTVAHPVPGEARRPARRSSSLILVTRHHAIKPTGSDRCRRWPPVPVAPRFRVVGCFIVLRVVIVGLVEYYHDMQL